MNQQSYQSSSGLPADPLSVMAASLEPKRAVSYIRVSTRGQAERDGAEEGFSIPAQREANKRKAASLGALIVKEFVDRGESARSANRPELQKMLRYLRETPEIDFCIVHKLDRLARNRADDVEINKIFDQTGVRLISTSENIDQTPGGMLLHGIMSSIAEFYSRNLANEAIKGMRQKAQNGGTTSKAPLGYRNIRARDDHGREIRTVELDPERAPLMRLAFSEYATGRWTVRQLAEHLSGLGLDVPATPSKAARPLSANRLQNLLRHPYYRGVVTFQGVEYPGNHEALVDAETWQTVQTILTSHRNGERQRLHNHYLKSTAVCGHCGSRLMVQNAKSRAGLIYPYLVCTRRHRLHTCDFSAVLIDQVEQRVAELYRSLVLSPQDRQLIQVYPDEELDHIQANSQKNIRALRVRRTQLEDQRRSLLQAHYAGAVPLELLKEEQDRISRELHTIQCQFDGYQANTAQVRQHLQQALDLLEDCHRMYIAAPDHLKKLLNQVFFSRILINPKTDHRGNVIFPPDRLNPTATQPPTAPDAADDPDPAHATDSAAIMTKLPLAKDTAVATSALGLLTPLFDQLASPALRSAAQHAHATAQQTPTDQGAPISDRPSPGTDQDAPGIGQQESGIGHETKITSLQALGTDRETPATDSDMWEADTDRETCLADQGPDPEHRPHGPSSGNGQSPQRKAPALKGRCLQTPDTDPNHALHDEGLSRGVVVPPVGLEPTTFGLKGRCSIH